MALDRVDQCAAYAGRGRCLPSVAAPTPSLWISAAGAHVARTVELELRSGEGSGNLLVLIQGFRPGD